MSNVNEEMLSTALADLNRMEEGEINDSIEAFVSIIDVINQSNGWNTERSESEWAALAHSEISEAYEEFRNGHNPKEIYFNGQKPEGMAVEYADCLIRIFHWFARHDIDPAKVMIDKLRYNATRGFRHGGKIT